MIKQLCRTGAVLAVALLAVMALADPPPGERPNLGPSRITQEQITAGDLSLNQLRSAGMRVFTTPFNKLDGYGDGPMDPGDTVSPGGRPTLGGNGTLLRVNGLDGQTCLECHSIISNATIPPRLGIGGVGGSVTNAMIKPTAMDPADLENFDSVADFNGRFANPPFIFGAGAVELLAIEMTQDLHAQRDWAIQNPGTVVELNSKGIGFGTIVADTIGQLDSSQIQGVDEDLIVKPFGRKGEFPTTRDFDIEAMQFHFGMQPVEIFGENTDPDGDGVVNEIMIGELSALHIFVSSSARPEQGSATAATVRGFNVFVEVGCASCHVPELQTEAEELPLRFPMDHSDPASNVYHRVDLTKQPAKFDKNGQGGVVVPLFADLKRHDMGDGLAETFALASDQRNREFTTARLWGIADTGPYLHDGRATTLSEAILLHGGEAEPVRNEFAALADTQKEELLGFLRTLRTPVEPSSRGQLPGVRGGTGAVREAPMRSIFGSDPN